MNDILVSVSVISYNSEKTILEELSNTDIEYKEQFEAKNIIIDLKLF